jgi:GNAT superfamily N-acetyltransferase
VSAVTIRPYEQRDHEAGRLLWVELTERHRLIYDDPTIGGDDPGAYFEHYLATPGRAVSWVAEEDGDVIGLTGLFVHGDHGEIEPVVVTAGRRSSGIGRALIATAIDEARRRGVTYLTLRPVARNVEAIELFHRIGFRHLGQIDLAMDLAQRPHRDGVDIHGLPFTY